MKLVLIIVAAVVIAGSVFADWKWRRWMEARRRDRGPADGRPLD
jgi:hypothetical protein